jgi:V8-like Glu-specific endopeptidase
MKTSKHWSLLVALATGACAVGGSPEDTVAGSDPIIGGTEATDYPEAALVNLHRTGQNAICSGSVIAPRVVLTAGHCISGWQSWDVVAPYAGGQKAEAVKGVVFDYTDTTKQVNPDQHDVGLVILGSDIDLAEYPTLAQSQVPDGTAVVNVGRINNGTASHSQLFVGSPVKVTDGASIGHPFAYRTDVVIQPGDSGGPALLTGSHTIVAVNSGSSDKLQVLARVDLVYDWIQKQIDASQPDGKDPGDDPGGDPDDPGGEDDPDGLDCNGIPNGGKACVGDVFTVCNQGEPMEFDCTVWGLSCVDDGSPGCG